jgi:low temperature requirement protein LtrA
VTRGATGVRPFELFFDLVFVFSLIQITNSIVEDDSLIGVVHGLVVLFLVWWVWVGFTSVANFGLPSDARIDWRPPIFILAMGLMLLIGMSIPYAFWENDQLFAYSFAGLYILWVSAYLMLVWRNPILRASVVRMGVVSVILPASLLASAFIDDTAVSVVLITVGLTAGVLTSVVGGVGRWPVGRDHLAERYELFIIIVLGESLISIGLGASKAERSPELIFSVMIAVALVAVMWRQYLIGVANTGRAALHRLDDAGVIRFSRIGYTLMHLLLTVGVIGVAAGLKVSMLDVLTPISPLFGGVLVVGLMIFMITVMVFRSMCTGRTQWWRMIPVVALGFVWLLAGRAPDVVLLLLVVAVAVVGSLPDLKPRASIAVGDTSTAPGRL